MRIGIAGAVVWQNRCQESRKSKAGNHARTECAGTKLLSLSATKVQFVIHGKLMDHRPARARIASILQASPGKIS